MHQEKMPSTNFHFRLPNAMPKVKMIRKKNDFDFTKMHLYELCFSFHFE